MFAFIVGGDMLSHASSSTASRSEEPTRAFAARGQVPRWALRQPAAVEGDAYRRHVQIRLILSDVEDPYCPNTNTTLTVIPAAAKQRAGT